MRAGAALVVVAVALLALGGAWWFQAREKAGQELGQGAHGPSAQPVSVGRVERRDMRVLVGAIGTLQSRATAVVRAKVSGELKTLHFKDVKDFGGGIKRPATVETDSPLYKGYKSVMLYSGVKKREVPDEVFTQGFMARLEGLRK